MDPSGSTIYTDNNNSGVSSFSGLAAGTYTVEVVDDNGCEQLIDITITEPPIFTVTASSTSSLCDGTPCSGTLSSTLAQEDLETFLIHGTEELDQVKTKQISVQAPIQFQQLMQMDVSQQILLLSLLHLQLLLQQVAQMKYVMVRVMENLLHLQVEEQALIHFLGIMD